MDVQAKIKQKNHVQYSLNKDCVVYFYTDIKEKNKINLKMEGTAVLQINSPLSLEISYQKPLTKRLRKKLLKPLRRWNFI